MQTTLHSFSPALPQFPFLNFDFLNTTPDLSDAFYKQKSALFLQNNNVQYDPYLLERHINPYKSFLPTFLLIKNMHHYDKVIGRVCSGKVITHGQNLNVIKSWITAPVKEYTLLWICPADKQLIHYVLLDELRKMEGKIDAFVLKQVWNDYIERMFLFNAPKDPASFWKEMVKTLKVKVNNLPNGPEEKDWRMFERLVLGHLD